jgi:hypothetical protein
METTFPIYPRSLSYIGVASFIASDICFRAMSGSSLDVVFILDSTAEISAVGSTPNHWSTPTISQIIPIAKLAVTI